MIPKPHNKNLMSQSQLEQENKALRLQADSYFNYWQDSEEKWKRLREFIEFKREVNPSNSQYINIMHFIKELENDIE